MAAMGSDGSSIEMSELSPGVVTFLDILGWKGIWQRHKTPLQDLQELLTEIQGQARGVGVTEIKSISDTIAIFTRTIADEEVQSAIELHGKICAKIIPRSIQLYIPVRGATSYGKYAVNDNTFVGEAVDEAAAWHESTDWIGVHLTPSALFAFDLDKSSSWTKYEPPFKQRIRWATGCASWARAWSDSGGTRRDLTERFRRLGPITPDIAAKFANSLAFVDATGARAESIDESDQLRL
jgi:hypothetical protein